MRRIALICLLVLAAVPASAEIRWSDVLLTDSGDFYRVEAITPQKFREAHPDVALDTSSQTVFVMTVQQNGQILTTLVPPSLDGGLNAEPSLAYDSRDNRLYLFWQRRGSVVTSELLVTSFKDGVWANETVFESGIWRLRMNLRIAITHYAHTTDDEGHPARMPAVTAHAVWWEQDGAHELARYAMLSLENGEVTALAIRDLTQLSSLAERPVPRVLPEDFDRAVFRTPFILDVPGSDSVDILFADWYTNTYEVLNVRPVHDEKNGVLHVPIGVTAGVMDAPVIRVRDIDAGLTAVSAPSTNGGRDLLMYTADAAAIDYVIYRDGTWTESRRILLEERVTFDEAVTALRRNLARH